MKTYTAIVDQYTLNRGIPKFHHLHCLNCHAFLVTYQKDGPGPLLRCYWDRIHAPFYLKIDQLQANIEKNKTLSCSSCKSIIGKYGIYEKEQREAFFLIENTFFVTDA